MADYLTRGNVAVAGRVTGNRDLITTPSLLRWAAEGKIFTAGLGAEDTAIDSAASLNDTTPTFGIKAPASSATFILPIYVRATVTGDGGAASYVQTCITKAAANCAVAFTLSGTALQTHNHNTNLTSSPQASALHTCTASALTNADYITRGTMTIMDAVLTTGAPMVNKETCFEEDLLKEGFLLSAGAGLLIYAYTGSTDSTWMPWITWAELTADDIY